MSLYHQSFEINSILAASRYVTAVVGSDFPDEYEEIQTLICDHLTAQIVNELESKPIGIHAFTIETFGKSYAVQAILEDREPLPRIARIQMIQDQRLGSNNDHSESAYTQLAAPKPVRPSLIPQLPRSSSTPLERWESKEDLIERSPSTPLPEERIKRSLTLGKITFKLPDKIIRGSLGKNEEHHHVPSDLIERALGKKLGDFKAGKYPKPPEGMYFRVGARKEDVLFIVVGPCFDDPKTFIVVTAFFKRHTQLQRDSKMTPERYQSWLKSLPTL